VHRCLWRKSKESTHKHYITITANKWSKITSDLSTKYYADVLISSKVTSSTISITDTVHFDFWQNASNRDQSTHAAKVLVTTVNGSIHKLTSTCILHHQIQCLLSFNHFKQLHCDQQQVTHCNMMTQCHRGTLANLREGLESSKLIIRRVNDRFGMSIIDPLYIDNRQICCKTFSSLLEQL